MRDKIAKMIFVGTDTPSDKGSLEYRRECNELADTILALEVDGKIIDCPDTGRLMICMDCENKNDPTKCNRTATIGDLLA